MLSQIMIRPTTIFLITTAFSICLFAAVRLIMHTLYTKKLCRWHYLAARLNKLRQNGAPLISKYGIMGLAIYVAIPIPGTGVVSGTILSWTLGFDWYTSFLAIIPACAISNILTTAGITGLLYLAHL